MLRRRARIPCAPLLVAAVAIAASTISSATPATASTRFPAPPAMPREPAAIEGFAPYQPQFFCRSTVEPGIKAFEKLVLRTYPVTHSLGDMRGCGVSGTSEHKDGRAWDWGADYRVGKQRAAGKSMLRWLFATDKYGNQDAMFRRLGLMYVIWNKRIWGAWDQRWEPYSCSGVTACHVNHMHFSFDWAGAEKKTSYWTGHVAGLVEPPLPRFTRLRSPHILRVSPGDELTARWLVLPGATYQIRAAGVVRHAGRATADAGCVRTRHGWQPADTVSIGGDQLHMSGARWQPTIDSGNGCNTRSHTYRLRLRPALLSTVTVRLSTTHHAIGRIRLRFVRIG